MSLDKVKEAVLGAANEKARKAIAEAGAKAERLLADARAADERKAADLVHEARLRAERDSVRELERIRHDNRLQILAAKNAAIDEVFRRARSKVAALPDSDALDMVGGWLGGLPGDVGGVLRVNPKDAARFTAGLTGLNRGRSGAGEFTQVVADAKVADGAVVEGAEYTVDCTISRRLEELRESLAGDLARTLFGA